jgi:hypothetical protein
MDRTVTRGASLGHEDRPPVRGQVDVGDRDRDPGAVAVQARPWSCWSWSSSSTRLVSDEAATTCRLPRWKELAARKCQQCPARGDNDASSTRLATATLVFAS